MRPLSLAYRTLRRKLLARCSLFPVIAQVRLDQQPDRIHVVMRARNTALMPRWIYVNGLPWRPERYDRTGTRQIETAGHCDRCWPGENLVAIDPRAGVNEVELAISPSPEPGPGSVPRSSDQALCRMLDFLSAAYIADPRSPYVGLWQGAWDDDDQGWRLPHWTWPSGVIVGALGALLAHANASLDERTAEILSGWRSRAQEAIGRLQADCIEQEGAWPVRWDYSFSRRSGVIEWISPNDVALAASYAFAYPGPPDTPHNARVFEAAWDWVREHGFDPDGHIRCGFIRGESRWSRGWVYVDAGFIFRIYAAAQLSGHLRERDRTEVVSRARRYLQRFFMPRRGYFLKHWRCSWRHDRSLFSRGQGWALEGLLAVLSIEHDEEIAAACRTVCDLLLRLQGESGAWYYFGDEPASGVDAKGTPVIALQLIRAGRLWGRSDYLAAARKALDWYEGVWTSDQVRFGSIWSREGCITTGLRERRCSFPYGVGFYLLARAAMEEIGER